MGMETEYAFLYKPTDPAHPSKRFLAQILEETLVERLGGAHATEGYFLGNGGAVSFEHGTGAGASGLFEMATPECSGPAQLLLYQTAQHRILESILPQVEQRLAEGFEYSGEFGLIKNCKDAEGEVYGVQENYQTTARRGWRLALLRLLVVPLALLSILPIVTHWTIWKLLDFFVEFFEMPTQNLQRMGEAINDSCIRLAIHMGRPLNYLFERTTFLEVKRLATAFLVSRTIVIGAGTLNPDGTYEISERASSITTANEDFSNRKSRPLFKTGNLVTQAWDVFLSFSGFATLFQPKARLQLGSSEANLCARAEYLKLGTTCLLLDMIESGFLTEAPQLSDPVTAIKAVSADLTMQKALELQDGSQATALEIQRWYHRRASQFLGQHPTPSLEGAHLLKLWGETLDHLEKDPAKLFGALDWVTKKVLISESGEAPIEVKKKIDLKYHQIGSGYQRVLERGKFVEELLCEDDIIRAMDEPPQETPALARSRAIHRLAGTDAVFSWNRATVGKLFGRNVIPFSSRREGGP